MTASPDNLYIGKGIVTFQPTGATTARDLGEVPEFEFTPSIETLDYFSSRAGVRQKVKSVVVQRGGTLRVVMNEFTAQNLALAIGGTITQNTALEDVIAILATNAIEGVVTFTGSNEVGRQMVAVFNKVSFPPAGSLGLISDEWGQIEINGEVLADNSGDFGTITVGTLA